MPRPPARATGRTIAQIGTPEQVAAAREILANARKALYGILAEDEPGPRGEA